MKEKEIEDFFGLISDVYSSLLAVLQFGTPEQKKVAIEEFNNLRQELSRKVSHFQEDKGVDFRAIEIALQEQKGEMSEKLQEMKQELIAYQKAFEPYVEKPKSKITKRLRKRARTKG
jgi:hypothetical protein